jgi:hypothetical protein
MLKRIAVFFLPIFIFFLASSSLFPQDFELNDGNIKKFISFFTFVAENPNATDFPNITEAESMAMMVVLAKLGYIYMAAEKLGLSGDMLSEMLIERQQPGVPEITDNDIEMYFKYKKQLVPLLSKLANQSN